ncbi:glutamate ABC transporter substrate-binding protein [Streptomyces sp. ID05-26A]|nr:glutamate ABC transporter substrate-binding protein [Streptomyces sp. ID05-26A]
MRRLLLATVLLLTACATPEVAVTPTLPLSVPAPVPTQMQVPPEIPVERRTDCRAEQSYRPQGPLPAPDRLPAGSAMLRIREKGKIVVGVGNGYLLSFRDPGTGQVRGFEAALAEEIAHALFGGDRAKAADHVQYRVIDAADRIAALRTDRVDLVLSSMTMTCERWQEIAFSAEYYSSQQRLLVHHDSGIDDIARLGGRKVCASRTSTNLRPLAEHPAKPIPVAAANTADCLLLLQQGQVDAVSTGDIILAGLAAQDPATRIVGPALRSDPTGIAIAPHRLDLVRFVNAVLERVVADGTWRQLQRTWLADQLGPAEPPALQYRPE